MMYCPRCNNTHWVKAAARDFCDNLSWLALTRLYRCIKCDGVQRGSVFLDFHLSTPRKPRRRIAWDRQDSSELICPQCGGGVRRSRRRGLEQLLFFSRAYRCLACEARFRTVRLIWSRPPAVR